MTGTRHLCMYYKCSWDYNILEVNHKRPPTCRDRHTTKQFVESQAAVISGAEGRLPCGQQCSLLRYLISGDSDVARPQTRPVWSWRITIYFVVCTFNNLQQFLTLLNILAQNNNKENNHNNDNIINHTKNASLILVTCNLTLTVLISWPSM